MAYTDLSYFVIQGQVFLAPRALNGALTGGYEHVGDVDQFQIDMKQKFEDIQESQSGLGLTAAHIPTETALNVKMNVLQPSAPNWERAVWGKHGGAVTAGSVTGEAITLYNDRRSFLAHPGVSSVIVAGAVENTDYTVDLANGTITVLATSTAAPAGTPLVTTVSYDYAAYTGKIEAFTTAQPIFSVRINGKNSANGQPILANIHQWAPNMSDMLDMISKKHMVFALNGMLLQDQTLPLPAAADDLSQFFSIVKG